MSQLDLDNPYANPAIAAPAAERAAFLQRTYSLLLAGIAAFAATLWAAGNVPAVEGMMQGLWRMVAGAGILGYLLYFGLFLGGAMLVHAFAERKPINLVLYFGYSFLLGLLVAPIVLYAAGAASDLLNQAALLTLLIFSGLTGYVFVTGKDFSFLRGILTVGFWAIVIAMVLGLVLGFSIGYWISVAIVVLMAGYILYDTSQILHRYPTTAHVSAACVLLVDVIILFKHLLFLLLSSRE